MKKFLTKLLVALLLLSTVTSCGKTSDVDNLNAADPSNMETAPEIEETAPETEETELPDSLPEKNFAGSDVTVWGDVQAYKYFYTAELTGDIINDAVHNRNVEVADRFNVNLVYELGDTDAWRDNTMAQFSASVMANAQAYDLASGVSCYVSYGVISGALQNLNYYDYLDFTKPWWSAKINNELTIGDRLYIASGFFDMPSVARTHVVFFSNDMAEKYAINNLYDIVREGSWTYDTMLGMAEKVLVDMDGNGAYTEADQYGLTSQWDVLGLAYGASGHSFTNRTEGNIAFTHYDDALIEANDMLYNLMYKSNFYYSGYTKGAAHNYDNMVNVFTDNRALFFMNYISYATDSRLREMGNYGIIPTPKFSDKQAEYGSYSTCFVTGIPTDAPDSERSSIILEALTAESYKDVLPAYYDIALSVKYVNDKESAEMLDIVFENTVCEFSYMFQGSWGAEIALSVGLNENYASWYAQKMPPYSKQLADMITDILERDY